jgi:diguanylate cyclase (GGDEF)-like protein
LPNRARFEHAISDALVRGVRPVGIHAVLLLDLKDFRRINDTFGHGTGDEVLIRGAALPAEAAAALAQQSPG